MENATWAGWKLILLKQQRTAPNLVPCGLEVEAEYQGPFNFVMRPSMYFGSPMYFGQIGITPRS